MLTILIACIQLRGHLGGPLRIFGQKQFDPESGVIKPARGIDTGSQPKADHTAINLARHAGNSLQGRHSGSGGN